VGEFDSILTGCWNQQVRLACISCVHVDLRNHVHAQVVVEVVEGMEDDDEPPAPYPRTVLIGFHAALDDGQPTLRDAEPHFAVKVCQHAACI
jgi:hypothetical protein